MVYILVRNIKTLINCKILADERDIRAKETVIVKRAYQILHYLALGIRKILLADLLHKLVVEGNRITIHHFFLLCTRLIAVSVCSVVACQTVVGVYAVKGRVKSLFPVLAF